VTQEPRSRSARFAARLVLAAALALSGCHRSGNREIWAEVNGRPIYRDEVESAYRRRFPGSQESVSSEQVLSLKLNLLNELIDDQLLSERAAQERITVAEAEVDQQIAKLSSPYSSDQFQKKLAGESLTPATLRDDVRHSLLIDKLMDHDVHGLLKVTPAEIEAYYRQHQAQFNVPETRYHLAQILVTVARDPAAHNLKHSDAVGRRDAQHKVLLIEQDLKSGQDFGKLAEEYSEDPATASGGGDMGYVPASSIAADAPLRLAVNAMRVGQISGVVRDQKGDYHILKLLERENAGQRPISDATVRKSILDTLMSEREQVLKAAYLEDLRNHAKVKDDLAVGIVRAGGDPALVK
jgi:peptidyl-prolyl cis-trans isomerase SurA